MDLGIFSLIANRQAPFRLQELVQATKVEEAFLERLLRGLASIGAIKEIGDDQYGPSKITIAFASQKGIAGAYYL